MRRAFNDRCLPADGRHDTTTQRTRGGIPEAVTLSVIETAGARVLTGHTGAVNSVSFSPDGAWLSTASEDKTARVWNAATGELLHTLTGHEDAVFAAPFSPDGSRIATVSADLTPRLWDARTGAVLRELTGHTGAVFGVAVRPNARVLATTSYDEPV